MEDDDEIDTLQQITNNNNNTKFARAQIEHRQLLNNLKSTIETLFLNCNSGDIWPTASSSVSSLTTNAAPDGLLCLHTILEQIFRNGIRVFKPDNSPDIWRFIEGLNWLNPSMTVSIANRCTSPINIHHIPFSRIKTDKALCWIYENLESNQMSQKLKYLLSDMEHLSNCYEITAFLRNEKFTESLFICLTSIELNQVNLLSQIQQTLYCNKLNTINHRRSTSHPNFSFVNNINIGKSTIKSIPIIETTTASTDRNEVNKSHCVNDKKSHKLQFNSTIMNKSSIKKKHIVNLKLRPWNSLPNLTPNSILLSSTSASSSLSTIKRFRCNTISQDIPTSSLFVQQQFLPLTVENLEKITNNSSAAKTCNTALKCITNNNVNTNNIQKVPSFSYKQQFIQNSGDSINTNNYDLLLQPTSLLKCDDIKIHFDRRHIPKTNRNAASEATNETAAELSEQQSLLSLDLNDESSTNTLISSDNNDINTHNNNVKQTAFLNNLLSPFTKNYDKLSTDTKYNTMFSSSAPADFVNTFLTIDGEKLQNRYRNSTVLETLNISPTNYNYNIDQSGPSSQQLSPMTMQILPSHGQSLTSYLQAAQFSHGNTDLERENAHFNVSEAMISAIEQIKWSEIEKLKKKQIRAVEKLYDNSPVTQTVGGVKRKSNIKKHKRWKQQHQQSQLQQRETIDYDNSENSINLYSTTDDSNCSTNSSCNKNNNNCSSNSSNSSMDDDGNDPKYLQTLSVSTHSVNDHTAYAEWGENSLEALSAEGVALSLISKFSDKQLPRASDFSWLVSEQDAPQQLLPLPGSFSVSPDDIYKISVQRGTKDWAPPRPQIIFTRHPAPDRKKLLFKQNQRCAGCGMKVAAAYSHKFRYCEYLGKYHCTGCHRNQISVIPARVLDRWDFTFHPVSVFSYRLLDQIWNYPLFNVKDLNNILYEKVRSLKSAKIKRMQLKFINDFIISCRFATGTKLLFDDISNHLITDIDLWSLADFISIKNGNFNRNINKLIVKCEEHIFICELCLARGFICELCPRKQVIFPWQIKIKRCTDCGTCYHINCWKDHCTKCVRLKKRQLR